MERTSFAVTPCSGRRESAVFINKLNLAHTKAYQEQNRKSISLDFYVKLVVSNMWKIPHSIKRDLNSNGDGNNDLVLKMSV